MGRRALSPDELVAIGHELPAWSVQDGSLVRAVSAPSFMTGVAWVNEVAGAAEAMDHHPDIDIRGRIITFRLRTHDLDALTTWDTTLAHRIDAIVDSTASAS